MEPDKNLRKRKYASRKCCVADCINNDLNSHMHTFPQMKDDENSCKRVLSWIRVCGNKSLLQVEPTKLSGRYFMCDDHFDDDQYVYPAKRQRVKRSAVPSLKCPDQISTLDLSKYVSTFVPQFEALDGPHKECSDEHVLLSCENLPSCEPSNSILSGDLTCCADPEFNGRVCTSQNDHNYHSTVFDTADDSWNKTQEHEGMIEDCDVRFSCNGNIENSEECDDVFEMSSYVSEIPHERRGVSINSGSVIGVVNHDIFIDEALVLDEITVESRSEITAKVVKGRIQRRCCVHGCENNNLCQAMFAFPRVMKIVEGEHVIDDAWLHRCRQWVTFSGNEKLVSKNISTLHKSFYVCAVHFSRDSFNGKQLKRNAIPSVAGPVPLREMGAGGSSSSSTVSHGTSNCHDEVVTPSADFLSERGAFQSDRLRDLKAMRSRKLSKKFEDLVKSFSMKVCSQCKEKYMYYPGLKKAHRSKNLCWKFSARNNMDPGDVPSQLKDLTFVEEQLIARVHPILCVYKLKGCQFGYRGNVINFCQDVKEFATQLPRRIDDLTSVLTVRFKNNRGNVTDFRVRARKVQEALLWLKDNNPYYHNIQISSDNLSELPADDYVFEKIASLTLQDSVEESDNVESRTSENDDKNLLENFDGDKVISSGVPMANFVTQNDHINSVLNWPELSSQPVSESTPGFIVCAFPTLFPFGTCDLQDEREVEVKKHDYFKHLLSFADDRFAKHRSFRFFALNMWMRHTALSNGNVFVNMDHELSKMTVGQLKERIQEDPSVLNKLMFMGSNIRGSKSFWKSRCAELKDMVEQIGLPTIFLTMSAADMYWPDLFRLLTDKDISELSMQERRILIQENPLVVDMFFQYRLECFMETVLQPKYEIVDYWYRIEYQHRGSPHVHGLFWLKDAPDVSNYVAESEEEKKKITKYFDDMVCAVTPEVQPVQPDQHRCEVRFQNVQDEEMDLSQMLKTVQMHNCSKGYCERVDKNTKRPYCRFHFPMDISPSAKMDTNSTTGELEFFPERNHDKLNKFNPFIISTWRANIDIAPVLSKKAIIEYLAKYVSKSEVGSSTLKEMCRFACESVNSTDRAKRAIHKILMKNCVERDISAQEVCHLLMGQKLYSAGGRDFVIVYTNSSKWVPLSVNNDNDSQPSEEKPRGKSFMQKYAERPPHLHHLSMWDVAKYYRNRNWKAVKKPNIVRVFPRLKLSADEEKNEDFYRQKVYLFVPWNLGTENTLKSSNETWRDVYDKHKLAQQKVSEININMTSGHGDPEVEENCMRTGDVMNEDWMIASRLGVGHQNEEIELGMREIDTQYDWHQHSRKYESYGDLKSMKGFIEREKAKDCDGFLFSSVPNVSFSQEQEAVKNLMENQIKSLKTGTANNLPKRVLVQGKAGTGKSLLIRYLVGKLHQEFGDGSFLLLGPTGVSAINIGGATIQSVLKIPRCKKDFKPLTAVAARKFCDLMEHVKFVIIDEYSMIGCSLLGMIDKRLREGTGINESFGSLNVYLFGDVRQLPPVKDTALFASQCNSELALHGRNIFNSFERHFILIEGHRQNDPKFLEVLDRLSNGEVTVDDYNILKTRFSTNVTRNVLNNFNDAIRLFSTKDEVNKYNNSKLHSLKDENGNLCPVARLPASHSGKSASYGSVDQADGLHSVLYLARGTRIMLRTNLWVQKGLVNGSTGTVIDLLYDENKEPLTDAPSILMCKFDDYVGPGIGPNNLVPIARVVRSWSTPSGGPCSRQQFPLVVCYACSIHKSQGLTLEKAVIDIGSKEFALGLSYVGLSRVKCLDGLLLMPFPFQRLQVIKSKKELKLRNEFEKSVFVLRA